MNWQPVLPPGTSCPLALYWSDFSQAGRHPAGPSSRAARNERGKINVNRIPPQFKDKLIEAIHSVDRDRVQPAFQILTEARDQGLMIFVCGNWGSTSTASNLLRTS
jgi:hypothetical protein